MRMGTEEKSHVATDPRALTADAVGCSALKALFLGVAVLAASWFLIFAISGEAMAAARDKAPVPDAGVSTPASPAAAGTESKCLAENAACVACHTNEGASFADVSTLAGLHAGLACATCHDDDKALDDLHAKTKAKRMPLRLKKTQVENATCLSCHTDEPGSDAFLALSEGEPLVDANGLEVNAHAMVGAQGHEDIACVSCHEVHDEADPGVRAQKVCATCHHANVYECFTCHEHG